MHMRHEEVSAGFSRGALHGTLPVMITLTLTLPALYRHCTSGLRQTLRTVLPHITCGQDCYARG